MWGLVKQIFKEVFNEEARYQAETEHAAARAAEAARIAKEKAERYEAEHILEQERLQKEEAERAKAASHAVEEARRIADEKVERMKEMRAVKAASEDLAKATIAQKACAMYDAFPPELSDLVVIWPDADEPIVYVADAVSELVKKNSDEVAGIIRAAACTFRRKVDIDAFTFNLSVNGETVKWIALGENPEKAYSIEEYSFILDHELGHRVVPNGMPENDERKHLAECAADAFATLRHIQCHGSKTDFLQSLNRVNFIVLGSSPIHYTDYVVQKVIERAEAEDITGLSLQETAALAGEIALKHHESNEVMDKLLKAFQPVKDSYEFQDGVSCYLRCIDVLKQYPNDPDIIYAGQRYLNLPGIKQRMKERAQQDPVWQDALDFVEGLNKPVTVHNLEQKRVAKPRI